MKPRLILGIVVACVLTLATNLALAEGQRVALVIGNSKYKAINQLINPANDARDVAEALRRVGFEVILRLDVDKGAFERALAEFARKSTGAAASLIYYAGHGVQSQKRNYLLPVDIEVQDETDLEFQALGVPHVMEAFDRVPGVKVLMLDACRDNPLDKRLATRTRSIGTRGLARIDASEGLVIAYATSPDQVAQDGSERNSPFTEAFIKRLSEPGLEIAMLFRRVTQDVYERTNGRQRPEVSMSLIGDFYLNPLASDSFAWTRIRDSNEAGDFEAFIQKYPQSAFVPDARRKLEIFARIRREREERALREREQQMQSTDTARGEEIETERRRAEVQRLAKEQADRRAAQSQELQRRADREEVERLVAARKLKLDRATPPKSATPDIFADRREVERLAEKRRQELEDEQVALERAQLRQLILEREKAVGAEAKRLDAAIRDLQRKQVERLAAQRRRQNDAPAEASKTATGAPEAPRQMR